MPELNVQRLRDRDTRRMKSEPSFERWKKSEPKRRDWSDLSKDFLGLVLGKLPWSERLRLCLVCKTWKECFHEIKNTQEFLPWVMCYDWNATDDGRVDSVCKLGDPFAQRCFTVEEATMGAEREVFVGAVPCASSHGWVLFSKVSGGFKHLFLYSPFTNEVVRFPKLETGFRDKASFSLNPSSSDCIVIALSIPKQGKLEIKMSHPGDESWESFEFYGEYYFICDVGYGDESFYCSFSNGKVGAFNVRRKEWELLWDLQSEEPSPPIDDSYIHMVVAFNGDPLLSCCNPVCLPCASWRIDSLAKKRVAVAKEAMEKQVMFRGCTSFSSFSVPAKGNARESGGKINFFFFNSVTPWSIYFSCIDAMRTRTPSPEYEWMQNTDLRELWIQPPLEGICRASNLLLFGSKDKSQLKKSH